MACEEAAGRAAKAGWNPSRLVPAPRQRKAPPRHWTRGNRDYRRAYGRVGSAVTAEASAGCAADWRAGAADEAVEARFCDLDVRVEYISTGGVVRVYVGTESV